MFGLAGAEEHCVDDGLCARLNRADEFRHRCLCCNAFRFQCLSARLQTTENIWNAMNRVTESVSRLTLILCSAAVVLG